MGRKWKKYKYGKNVICRRHDTMQQWYPKFCAKTYRKDKFSNVTGYRISLNKSVAFVYPTNKHEIVDTFLLTQASKKIRIDLPK